MKTLPIAALALLFLTGASQAQSTLQLQRPMTIAGTITANEEQEPKETIRGTKTTVTTATKVKTTRFANKEILLALLDTGAITSISGYTVTMLHDGPDSSSPYAYKKGSIDESNPEFVPLDGLIAITPSEGGVGASTLTDVTDDTTSTSTSSGSEKSISSVSIFGTEARVLGTSAWSTKFIKVDGIPVPYESTTYSGAFYGAALNGFYYDPAAPLDNGLLEGTVKVSAPTVTVIPVP